MAIVVGFDTFRQRQSLQDVTSHQSNEYRVLEVMIEGITPCQALNRAPCESPEALCVIFMCSSEDPAKVPDQKAAKLSCGQSCDRLHISLQPTRAQFTRAWSL